MVRFHQLADQIGSHVLTYITPNIMSPKCSFDVVHYSVYTNDPNNRDILVLLHNFLSYGTWNYHHFLILLHMIPNSLREYL